MSIFDKAREKALKKLSEEDEEELLDEGEDADEADVLEEGAEGEPPQSPEDEDAVVDDAVDGGDNSVDDVVDESVDEADGVALEEEPTDDVAGASSSPTEEDGAPEESNLPAEGTSPIIDKEDNPSDSADGEATSPYTGDANTEEDSAGTAEGPLSEREQRFASEIARLQGAADQAAAQVADLQAQLEEANARLEQVSSTAEEAIEGAAVNSGPPIFDHAAYRMMDEAAAEEYAAEHDRKMSEYYSRRAEERYQPYIDEHDKAVRAEGRRGAIGRLVETGELPGIGESEADIFRILDEVPALQNDDSESAVAAAYLISVGLDAINSKGEGKEKTAAEIVAEIETNPEVMKLLAEKQAAALEENGKVPTFTRRASARSVPSSAPITLSDASARARKRFGL